MDATGTFFSMIGQVVATSVEASRASDLVVARDRWVVVDDEVTPPTFEAQILAGSSVRVDPELLQYLSEKTDMPIFAEPVDQGAFFHLSVAGDSSDIDDRRLKMVAEQLGIPTLIRKVPSDFFKILCFKEDEGWSPSSLSDDDSQIISSLFTETTAEATLKELMIQLKVMLSEKVIDAILPQDGQLVSAISKKQLIEKLEEDLSDFMHIQRSESNVGQQFGFSGTEDPKCYRVIFELTTFLEKLTLAGISNKITDELLNVKFALFMRNEDWVNFSVQHVESLSVMLCGDQRLLKPEQDATTDYDLLTLGIKVCPGSSLMTVRKIKVIADISGSMLGSLDLLKEGMRLSLHNLIEQAIKMKTSSLPVSIIFHDTTIFAETFDVMNKEQRDAMFAFIAQKDIGGGTEYIEAYTEAFKEELTANDLVIAFTDGQPNSYRRGDYAQYVSSILRLEKFPARFYGFYIGNEGAPAINILRAIGSLSAGGFIYPVNQRNFIVQCERISFPSGSFVLTIGDLSYKLDYGIFRYITVPLPKEQPFSLGLMALNLNGVSCLPVRKEQIVESSVEQTKDSLEKFYATQMKFVFEIFQSNVASFPNINALSEEEIAQLRVINQDILTRYLSSAVCDKVTEYLDNFNVLIKARVSGDVGQMQAAMDALPTAVKFLILSDPTQGYKQRGQAFRPRYRPKKIVK